MLLHKSPTCIKKTSFLCSLCISQCIILQPSRRPAENQMVVWAQAGPGVCYTRVHLTFEKGQRDKPEGLEMFSVLEKLLLQR